MLRLIPGDCEIALGTLAYSRCIIADPPDNLGLAYSGFKDARSDYYQWIKRIMYHASARCDHFWLSYYWQHDLEISSYALQLVKDHGHLWKKYIWRYTFGQHVETDCGSGFRYLLRLSSEPILPPDRVPSQRQLVYNDPRANPAGKIPDDVWEFPRVTGNSHERRAWHPTQHPEGVYSRIVRMSSKPGDTIVDLFGGTGTLFRVAKAFPDRHFVACELSPDYCSRIADEHGLILESETGHYIHG